MNNVAGMNHHVRRLRQSIDMGDTGGKGLRALRMVRRQMRI
jgi:hypothetical protein